MVIFYIFNKSIKLIVIILLVVILGACTQMKAITIEEAIEKKCKIYGVEAIRFSTKIMFNCNNELRFLKTYKHIYTKESYGYRSIKRKNSQFFITINTMVPEPNVEVNKFGNQNFHFNQLENKILVENGLILFLNEYDTL